MPPLTLSRIKAEYVVSPTIWQAKTNIVKEEYVATDIKVEPKIQDFPYPIQVKFITTSTDSTDTKPITISPKSEPKIEIKANTRRRKRKLSNSSPAQRRPQLPLAIRVHRHLMNKHPSTLTKRELDSLTWAESVIVYSILRRSQETVSREALVKVKNPIAVIAREEQDNDEPIPNTLQLEILDSGSPDGKYSIEKGKLIERAFNKAVVDHILNNSAHPTPRFGLASFRNGVLILACKDTSSYDFAKVTVNKLVPWEHAKLRAIPFEGTDLTYVGRFHAPDIDIERKDVIKVLQSQNPRINMQNWKVIEEKLFNPGFKTYYLVVAQPPVTFLQNKYLKLLFGASEIALECISNENLNQVFATQTLQL